MKNALFAWIVVCAAAMPARAQGLPTEPVSVADGRVVFGAEITATLATADPGFFNYTDYENSALRNHVLAVMAREEFYLTCLAGTVVDFPNSDKTFHTVFTLSNAKRFDLGRNGFRLDNAPAGTYTVVGWYEGEQHASRAVIVPAGGLFDLELVVP